MQSVLVILSSAPGAVFLGGRLAGEVDGERPLTLPVAPTGALLLELRPFSQGLLPLTTRVPFSRGVPLASALRGDARLHAALWPGGVVELELTPQPLPTSEAPAPLARLNGVDISLLGAGRILCQSEAGQFIHSLPDGALPPRADALPGGALLRGETAGGDMYALVLSPDGGANLLTLAGREITLLEDGAAIQALILQRDTVGHARLDTWTDGPEGWRLTGSEPLWAQGAPAWPQTPQATALAAIEAAQLGLTAEAASYFSPAFPCQEVLSLAAQFDGCVPLRYPLPDGGDAVGLMRLEDGLLRVVPASYRAERGGAHGLWQLEALEIKKV